METSAKLAFWMAAGALAPVAGSAQDSSPVLLSTTGGGTTATWSSLDALKAAAAKGNPRALGALGQRTLDGDGVPKDGLRALDLLEKAARAGDAASAFRIGMLLDDGVNVERDSARAVPYFRAAAAGGVGEAFYNVGAAYASARGVHRDFVEGLAWFILAAQHGANGDAGDQLKNRFKAGGHPERIAAAEQLAPEIEKELDQPLQSLLPPPAPLAYRDAGSVTVHPNDGSVLEASEAGPDKPAFVTVTAGGHRHAWQDLADLKADAASGQAVALAELGHALVAGEGIAQDVDSGVATLQQAAQAGSPDAALELAHLYTHGDQVPADDQKACAYNLQAAQAGVDEAIINAAAYYLNGQGTPRNVTEALAWMLVAQHFGDGSGVTRQVENYLTAHQPDQVPVAHQRAVELEKGIAAALAKN